jgi:hypothetical protein
MHSPLAFARCFAALQTSFSRLHILLKIVEFNFSSLLSLFQYLVCVVDTARDKILTIAPL